MRVPYKSERIELEIGSDKIKLDVISNIDELFDELASRDTDDPDVKDERIPYWADLWPSAIVLSEYISAHSEEFYLRNVIELGCGLGLAGIVAGKAGAKVVLSDYLPAALEFAKSNWRLNLDSEPDVELLDWRKPTVRKKFDIIIASDVAYESKSFKPLVSAINKLLSANGKVLLTEPNRKFASGFIKELQVSGMHVQTSTTKINFRNAEHTIHLHIISRQ